MSNRRYDQYYQLAADVLKVKRPSTAIAQLLEAAEAGDVYVCEKLLKQYKGIVDVRCDISGDTPIIAAARTQQKQVIDLLLKYSADCTLQNNNGESVLEVTSPIMKKHILKSLSKSCHMSNTQQLLHSAWLGDTVSVKRSLSGSNILDVNCCNSDGLTPLLLVTRDTKLFDTVQHVMSTEYDPVQVMEELIGRNSNIVDAQDIHGRSALHLVANNKSVQAKKMVSLLLQNGADAGITDNDSYTPLHTASKNGHTAIIVALIEEGNVNIDQRGGDKGNTPLMLSASHGHKEATEYLLSKGANVSIKDNYGDDAMSLAKTPSLTAMIKDAWVQQTTETNNHIIAPPIEHMSSIHPTEDSDDDDDTNDRDSIHQLPESEESSTTSIFLTERQTSSEEFSLTKLTQNDDREGTDYSIPHNIIPLPAHSEVEADDELDDNRITNNKRFKPATRRNQVRHTMEETIANKRNTFPRLNPSSPQTVSKTSSHTNRESLSQYNSPHQETNQKRALHERLSRSRSNLVIQKSIHSLSKSMESLITGSSSPITGHSSPINKRTSPSTKPYPSSIDQRRATLPSLSSSGGNSEKSSNKHNTINKSSSIGHLPNILSSNMKPVALVSVDAENENIRIQKLTKKVPSPEKTIHSNTERNLMRSKSLQSIRHSISSHSQKRSSFDTCRQQYSEQDSKVPLLPSVITPELLSIQSKHPFQSTTSRTNNIQSSSSTSNVPSKNTLSIVSELDIESSSSDKTITLTPDGQKVSLLPTSDQQRPENVVINIAVKEDDIPLSPIWDMAQKTDSDTSSEYISSFIGAQTPFPHNLFSLDHNSTKRNIEDSGQGESDEDKRQSTSDENSDIEEVPIDREVLKWKRGRILGRGAFGKVCEGLMDNAKLIAVKEIELYDGNTDKTKTQFAKIQLEVDILRSLNHNNIVQYFGASMDDYIVYIFMEFISGGSLQSMLKRFGSLNERTVAHYTRQITMGLEYLHNNGIIHRDIKGANVMVTSKGVVKLIDFGCAKRYCQDLAESFHSVRGTPFWMSPEVIRGQSYGRKSDIWSLGCTIHEMAMTKPPWGELPPEAAMFHIGLGQNVLILPDRLSLQLKDIINLCLTREQHNRPTAKEILCHPFLVSNEKQHCVKRKSRKKF